MRTKSLNQFLCISGMMIFIILMVTSCFSPWEGNAELVLYLGNPNQTSRMLDSTTGIETDDLIHVIELDGPSGPQIINVEKGNSVVPISVVPGRWNITIKAYLEGDTENKLCYQGSASVDLVSGNNNAVTVKMNFVETPPDEEPSLSLTIEFEQIADNELYFGTLVLSRSGESGPRTIKLAVNKDDYDKDSIMWSIYDTYREGPVFVLSLIPNHESYNINYDLAGRHILSLVVRKNGVPYSMNIPFTVIE